MLSYEFLDRVADSHNPILGATWIVLSVFPALLRQWRAVLVRFFLGITYLLVAYGFMWLDSATGIWGKFSLDYSTHAAVAFAMAAAIATISPKLGIAAAVLVSIYIPLMIYQGYHTLGDIFSTAAVAGLPVLLMAHTMRKRRCAAANNSFKPTPHRGVGHVPTLR